MNDAFLKIKAKVKGHEVTEEAFFVLRDEITHIVENCADNVKVVVYFDFVLDKPLTVGFGKEENRLRITIKKDGKITLSWTKKTWRKYFSDVLNVIKSLSTDVVKCLVKSLFPWVEFDYTKKSITL